MRYLFGFLCVCTLGVVSLVGCSEECQNAEECDDQNACTDDGCNAGSCDYIPNDAECDFDGLDDLFDGLDGICMGGVCEENPCDDGSECTEDLPSGGSCAYLPCSGCRPCDWNGVPGVCMNGVCEEDPCLGVVCDDGDTCTHDSCDYMDGTCNFSPRCSGGQCRGAWCDPADGSCVYTPLPDGTPCHCTGVICIGDFWCSRSRAPAAPPTLQTQKLRPDTGDSPAKPGVGVGTADAVT